MEKKFDFISKKISKAKRPLLIILGPTASGKTALSIELAKHFNGEIISADSRQIYRHMDIGTDKIPMDKREGIVHHCLDIIEPNERFTVADFKAMAEKTIDDILASGRLPVLVGGTGLYIRAVKENFALPPENLKIKKALRRELEERGAKALYEKLQKLDPENAAKIHPNNMPYVVRALEILLATGKPKNSQRLPPKYDCTQIGLFWPREDLFKRINSRVDDQIKRGLLDETSRLLGMGFSKDLPSMSSLGYREMIKYLDGELDLNSAIELLKKNTRNYAKRQMTWFKKDKAVTWINFSKGTEKQKLQDDKKL